QKEFINAIDKISDEITKADEFQTQLNNKELISTMNIVNEYNKKFLSLVRQSYTYSNVIQYVVDLKKQLDENLNVNQNKISKKEYSEALRVSSNVKELIKLTNKYLQQLNFDSTRISIRSIVTQLEPALNFFKQYDRIALLIDNGLGFAKISLEVIENNIGELEHSFEIINKYFANDNYSEMIIETNLIKAGLKKIHINYSELLKRNEQKEYYDRVTFLKDLFALINNIALWENSLNVLYQNIIHKYQSAIELLDKIYDLQWVLTQFIGLINGKTINVDMPTIVLAEDHLKAINLLISKLNEDYATNFNSALETIKNIEKDISNIYTIIDVESKIKDYARALIFYTNKYRLEDKEIANVLNNADELFKQNQYRKVIDTLLPTLRHIKKSAKANGYNFK
ncbi:MAG: hypothetical protein HUJ52_01415, partial [Malacoplasma sp.]|nr:hypothetical protein [Malacoplasma sp.]